MANIPEMATDQRVLHRFTAHDAEAFFNIVNDKDMNAHLPLFPFETIEDAAACLRNSYPENRKNPASFRYAIYLKADTIPAGHASLGDGDSHDWVMRQKKNIGVAASFLKPAKRVIAQSKNPVSDTSSKRTASIIRETSHMMKNIEMIYRHSRKS